MSARDVLAGRISKATECEVALGEGLVECSTLRPCHVCRNEADDILAALDAAGYAPPLLKAVIHRALQDAFQAGAKSALREDGPSITADKHKYCDAALSALQAKETS